MAVHIVQTQKWADFKNSFGTPAVSVGGVVYTKHPIPLTNLYFGYSPKVNPFEINFEEIKKSLEENDCININFDVPNVETGTETASSAMKLFEEIGCIRSPRDQFARSNVVLDLTLPEEHIMQNMHYKHRYNIKYAQKKGVTTRLAKTEEDFGVFYELFKETSIRQKYFVRAKSYYQKIWEMFRTEGMAHIITTYHDNTPLASWMLLSYQDILYYPYGGSSEKFKNLHGSTLVGWEAILLGKRLGCHTFDMWGAADDINDTEDPWWGFTNFKLRFGGKYVKYIDSFDYVLNPSVYKMFSVANSMRWKLLRIIK